MLRIGLTGGIGSGKTTVARIFEAIGIPVYYADVASKKLMSDDPELRQSIIKHFGAEAYHKGELNRNYLSGKVFSDPEKLAILNSLVHPATILDANHWISQQQAPYIIKEAALIFESASNQHLDFVIGVHSPKELRISRTMQRDNVSREKVTERMERQMDEVEKMRLCNIVILNDEKHLLIPQVLELHDRFLNEAAN